ncbi:MAG: 5'-deoxyadenosine deaminase [Peptococcales bacterium]|jgi:5-methylthioadenosine/S-adenosylhomocysteine deaminase
MISSLLVKNGIIVTMNKTREIVQGDIYIEDGKIVELGQTRNEADEIIDARGKVIIPGLVQPHIHLCQTLFRGQSDDKELLDWLKQNIWPLEGAHDEKSIYISALLGLAELIKSGTTSIVDMATVHHTNWVIKAIAESGIRALVGKAMMDFGSEVPQTLQETTKESLEQSVNLLEKWHGYNDGLIQYAFAPRFIISCSEGLLKEVGRLAKYYNVKIHTHSSENQSECKLVEELFGMRNVKCFEKLGLIGPNLILAHCIWLDEEEMNILASSQTNVVHCPSSNLKLASGIAKVPDMLAKGCQVSIAADSAACNNNLDPWMEMRIAALIQKPLHGPTAMPAWKVFELATLGGAKVMGRENEIGSLEVGKKADLVVLDLKDFHVIPQSNTNIYSRLVYEAKSSDVETTIVNGKVLMQNRKLMTIDAERLKSQVEIEIKRVAQRANVLA